MLQTTTDGKYTSLKGAVIVSTVVTTFELMKSYKKKRLFTDFLSCKYKRIAKELKRRDNTQKIALTHVFV